MRSLIGVSAVPHCWLVGNLPPLVIVAWSCRDPCLAVPRPTLEFSVMDDFIEAASFEGSKEGYVFKMGRNGLGYYVDGAHDDFDVNAGVVPTKAKEYDMEAHARGEALEAERAKEPGHGRVGTLGELLAGLPPFPNSPATSKSLVPLDKLSQL